MKNYKNIEEINKEWGKYGVRINEKGELVANHEGKEYKIGQANFFTDEGKKPVKQKKQKKQQFLFTSIGELENMHACSCA